MDSCSVNATDPLKPKCPVLNEDNVPVFPEWLTIIMLCVYLLFANILLLNLLIAIFNYTFTEVQDNTDIIWKFQRYELIKEYHSRPALPPPFILLSHLYLLITHVFLRRPSQKHRQFRQELSQSEEEELLSWESFMKDNYLASLRQDKSQSVEHRIQDTAEKIGTMSELLEREHEMGSAAMMKRLARLEEQVSQSTRALQWIMDTLKSQNFKSKQEAPLMACVFKGVEREPAESSGQDPEREKTHHFYARQHRYPGSTVKRFPVPEEKVPWEVEFTPYLPPIYNQQEIGDSDASALDSYRNPAGRTGIKGIGALKSLGPNYVVDPIITRTEGGVLEFLAVWEQTAGCWTFPGGPAQPGEPLPERLKTTLGVKLYQRIKAKMESAAGVKEVLKGYVDDSRNTDNAWVETTVITVHIDWRGMLTGNGGEMGSWPDLLQWQQVSSKTAVCPYQQEALRLVAQLHHINF